jgi:regulator of protease activity HflC (stomatin/prohibitin superfamily)
MIFDKRVVVAWVVGIATIITLFLLYESFYFQVEQKEYAVVANSFTMQFSNNVLTQGVYWFLPPFSYLMLFTRTMQNIEVGELDCMTGDSVMIKLHVAVQFQYDSSKSLVPIVLKDFGGDSSHKDMLRANIRSTILNTCLQFDAIEYYEMRSKADSAMYQNLEQSITSDLGSAVRFFQLLDIKYPDDYMEALHKKQNIHQALMTAQNDRNTEIINANTNLKESTVNANINIINANNMANITNYNADVQEEMIFADWNAKADYYLNIKTAMHLDTTQLLNYMKDDVIRSSQVYSSI